MNANILINAVVAAFTVLLLVIVITMPPEALWMIFVSPLVVPGGRELMQKLDAFLDKVRDEEVDVVPAKVLREGE
ncbi:MAG: hypothetical protein CL946_03655 [Ectothiorhodospiraceae bacterium]|nr:hypothetical protein [Ectothiorhodospiraceae bacterium]